MAFKAVTLQPVVGEDGFGPQITLTLREELNVVAYSTGRLCLLIILKAGPCESAVFEKYLILGMKPKSHLTMGFISHDINNVVAERLRWIPTTTFLFYSNLLRPVS